MDSGSDDGTGNFFGPLIFIRFTRYVPKAWDLSQTRSTFPPPFFKLVYDQSTDVHGQNARDKTL